MSAVVLSVADDQSVEIPDVRSLTAFRRWAASKQFPEQGRIDYLAGRIEVEMSPERAFSHGTTKVEIIRALANFLAEQELGLLFADRMRVSSSAGDLSVEPDVVLVTHARLESGQVELKPAASPGTADFVELIGGPDLVVEIVSPSSVVKDTERLPDAYFLAGVREYWIVDALGDDLQFQVFGRGRKGFVARRLDVAGYHRSDVLDRRVRFTRRQTPQGFFAYRLLID
jgi:Uma2 family endonuclease